MLTKLFKDSEWIGEGRLTMTALSGPAYFWVKYTPFATGEVTVEMRSEEIGRPIVLTYFLDQTGVKLNHSLVGSMEGRMMAEGNFAGIEYGNEVLGYAGFEAYNFQGDQFSYEAKFINGEEETCEFIARCVRFLKAETVKS